MHSAEAVQIARLAALESAVLALLRAAKDEGYDGLSVTCVESFDASTIVDLTYLKAGVACSGHSL